MTITLDHVIIPSHDRQTSAKFFATIFDLSVDDGGHFAPVRVNGELTFDFADSTEVASQHYAFVVADDDFDAIFQRIRTHADSFGSGPYSSRDGKINHRRGGRGVYFTGGGDPHLWEIMTTPETRG